MLKRSILALMLFASLLPAQTNLPSFSLPASAEADMKILINPVSKMFADSFALSVPFSAAAGNYAPLNYHFLIPLLDIYLTAPAIIGLGKIDLSVLDTLSIPGAASSIKGALSPLAAFPYFPTAMLAVTAKARLQLPIPIVKDLEFDLKFGFVPQVIKTVIGDALKTVPGFGLNYDATLFGIGARYRLVNLKVFTFGAGVMYNYLDYTFNLNFDAPRSTIGTYTFPGFGTTTLEQQITLNLTNQFKSSVISLDVQAGLNLLLFQLYAGVGVNFDLSGPYQSSYLITGNTYTNNVLTAAPIRIGGTSTATATAVVPKFAVGFRLSLLDVQAESTFDLKAMAARAGVAVSF